MAIPLVSLLFQEVKLLNPHFKYRDFPVLCYRLSVPQHLITRQAANGVCSSKGMRKHQKHLLSENQCLDVNGSINKAHGQ